eukprot:NODE_724_length_4780_cov_0.259346.p2 type:complete len:457 gc:universal NODE_724_length_4780_cov_0.259346:2926-4296(+)
MSLWGGRFEHGSNKLFKEINYSIDVDKRLAIEDLDGSIAYSYGLLDIKLISKAEQIEIERGLSNIKEEWESNKFELRPGDEDIHSANERRLIEIVGEAGKKIHTGRSRNDQVVTDMRLWMKKAIRELDSLLKSNISTFLKVAERDLDILMPGYTHLQRAQPIKWSLWVLQYSWYFLDDLERLKNIFNRVDRNPLGSGALSGHPYDVNRDLLKSKLGFSSNINNSLFAVSDREFVMEFLWAISLISLHLSRWAEDLIIYSSSEYNFVECDDEYSSGSSLMPQKKNPDALELIRGKSGRIFGILNGLFISIKGLPSTYNKDLQDDKKCMFDGYDVISLCLQVSNGIMNTLKINASKMRAAITPDMMATELADYLVRKGIPFRDTHHIAGKCVLLSESLNKPLNTLSLEELQTIDLRFEKDVESAFDVEAAIEKRSSTGGTSTSSINAQIAQIKAKVNV